MLESRRDDRIQTGVLTPVCVLSRLWRYILSNINNFFDPNTHCECVSVCVTFLACSLLAPCCWVGEGNTHCECVLMAPNFENLKIVIFNVEEVTRFESAGGSP